MAVLFGLELYQVKGGYERTRYGAHGYKGSSSTFHHKDPRPAVPYSLPPRGGGKQNGTRGVASPYSLRRLCLIIVKSRRKDIVELFST